MKIITIIGGVAKDSINKKLFELIMPLSPKEFEFDTFGIDSLPFFSQDIERNPPESVVQFKEKIINADGVLFITPEYNRSIPGVLKNAVDWVSRPYLNGALVKKPVAVLGAATGTIGTFGAQNDLRKILSSIGAAVMYQPEIYLHFYACVNDKGELADTTKKMYEKFLNSFREWILKNK
ncbi:MAG: NAD(P)H-dependent oxidoreductase [Endomicrobium sp.]|jgi:chromate reductase|nr:NAD(P)H-dependent oxidoreductase [Endomicrobium sp.]